MAPRREIRDSDDDGSDFGDGAEFEDSETHRESEVPRDTLDASHNASSDSTDPSFFQRVYDEQQAAADAQDTIPDTAPARPSASTWTEISWAPPPGQKPPAEDFSSLTSLTDPAPTTRKSRRNREVRQVEVIDLTDITTPMKEAASRATDVWEGPSSTRSQRTTRTYGKRKRAGQQPSPQQDATSSIPPTQDPYDIPDATPPTRKRPKRGAPSTPALQAPESSPAMLVATEPALSSDRQTRSSRARKTAAAGFESSVPDTAPLLYVAQSTLTASQKQQYRVVSQSFDATPDVPETSLPEQPFAAGETYKSSGLTTIAYPTPSRIGSSRERPPLSEGLDEHVASPALLGQDVYHQPSSPDVLTDMSTTKAAKAKGTRTKVVLSEGLGPSEPEPAVTSRKTRKRKIVQDEDDSGGLEPSDNPQAYRGSPQEHARHEGEAADPPNLDADRHVSAPPEVEPINAGPIETPAAPSPETGAQKKRGRKKKGTKPQEPAPDANEPTPPAEEAPEPASVPAEAPEPPAKRKRGRPRKPETATKASERADEPEQQPVEAAPAQPLSELARNSQQGWQSKSRSGPDVENDSGEKGGCVDEKENGHCYPQPGTAAEPEPVAGGKARTAAAVADAKEMEKEQKQQQTQTKAGLPGQNNQKVQYRVGLSKRSRIAPLLKSLKKPS